MIEEPRFGKRSSGLIINLVLGTNVLKATRLAVGIFLLVLVGRVCLSAPPSPPPIAPTVPPGFRNRPPGPDPYLKIPPLTNTARLHIESTLPRSFWGRYTFPEYGGTRFIPFDYRCTRIAPDKTHYWITYDQLVELRVTITNDSEAHLEACIVPYGTWYFCQPLRGPCTNRIIAVPIPEDTVPMFYRIHAEN